METLSRDHGRAWLCVCLLLAAHVIEEAAGGFLGVWNPFLATVGQGTGIPMPQFAFADWLARLVIGVTALIALTPLAYRGVRWLAPASYVLGIVMVVNGINHLLSPVYLDRFLPGQFTSPLLIATSLWLMGQARRVQRSRGRVPTPAISTAIL
jgi:hypothetical protein